MNWMTIIGDAAWILALGIMTSFSFQAWGRIPPDAKVPMHFDQAGKPTRRASRTMALTFNPGLALAAAIFMRVAAHRTAGQQGTLIVTLLSVALAPMLAFTHLWTLDKAMKVLDAEGVLRR
ncbi:MAG: hypothetical protein JWM33_3343 [Caulobacteraceae bacterium]|nr:hypothetical protein [Caulobacteraceae bacterium]